MKKTVAILTATALTAIATPAFAQVEDESPFTGLRGEGIVGYDNIRAGSSRDDDGNNNNDQSVDGVIYGIGLGYDVDLGSVVIGAEGEFVDATADTEFDDGDFEGFGFGNVSAGRDLYLGGRIGVNAAPNVLAYVKGGYTNAKLNILTNDGSRDFENDFDLDGYRIGAGGEYAINQNTFFKLEYRYSNYSRAEVDQDGTLPDSDRFDVDLDRHQVVAGVGIRF
ncbi:MAG: outer membrane beta-barrel protein [Alteripontixanthobacter sp.]